MADPEHRQQFMTFKKAWMLSGMQQSTQEADVDELWAQTAAEVFKEAKEVPISTAGSRGRWLSIAASIAVLLVASFWLYRNYFADRPMAVATRAGTEAFDLPDGSAITLNRFAALNYEPSDSQRTITLTGDAYFDVSPQPDRPFIIRTQNVEIEVLGTSFYVDARENQPEVQVMVAEGSVAVRADSQTIQLSANEKAVFRKDSQVLEAKANDDPNFQAVKTGRLIFQNSSMEYIAFALERQFDREVRLNLNNSSACALYGNYDNKPLDSVLFFIENALSIQIEEQGDSLIFTGDCQ
jgi:ferric-dicitrate binding protein FerR (iron transport regulator)